MELRFDAVLVEWRGPAPYRFAPLPPEACAEVDELRTSLSYGWGVVPVTAQIGATSFTTSLFPKDGGYLLPVKDAVRRSEGVDVGSAVQVRLVLGR